MAIIRIDFNWIFLLYESKVSPIPSRRVPSPVKKSLITPGINAIHSTKSTILSATIPLTISPTILTTRSRNARTSSVLISLSFSPAFVNSLPRNSPILDPISFMTAQAFFRKSTTLLLSKASLIFENTFLTPSQKIIKPSLRRVKTVSTFSAFPLIDSRSPSSVSLSPLLNIPLRKSFIAVKAFSTLILNFSGSHPVIAATKSAMPVITVLILSNMAENTPTIPPPASL